MASTDTNAKYQETEIGQSHLARISSTKGLSGVNPRDWRKEIDALDARVAALEAKAALPSAADLDAVAGEQKVAEKTEAAKAPRKTKEKASTPTT